MHSESAACKTTYNSNHIGRFASFTLPASDAVFSFRFVRLSVTRSVDRDVATGGEGIGIFMKSFLVVSVRRLVGQWVGRSVGRRRWAETRRRAAK